MGPFIVKMCDANVSKDIYSSMLALLYQSDAQSNQTLLGSCFSGLFLLRPLFSKTFVGSFLY